MILGNQSSKPDSHFTVVPIEAFQKMLTNVVRFERDFNINTLVYIHVAPSLVIVNIGNS